MWKYLYKTLLISTLCGSLLMVDFAIKGNQLGIQMNMARAEKVSTGGIEDEGLASTLEMAAIGLIASRLFKYGKLTPDMMVAAAGGLAFVAGEILAYAKLKEAKEKIETDIKRSKTTGDITDEQRQALIRLIQMYRNSKDTAETKKNLQLAAAAAFAAAGVMAYFFTATDAMVSATCRAAILAASVGGLSAVEATCKVLLAATYTAAAGAKCQQEAVTCRAAVQASSTALETYDMSRIPPSGTSCSDQSLITSQRTIFETSLKTTATGCAGVYTGAIGPAVNGGCTPVSPAHISSETMCSPPIPLVQNNFYELQKFVPLNLNDSKQEIAANPFRQLFEKYFMNSARADLFSPMGIASSVAITLIMTFSSTAAMLVDTNIMVPARRGIIWAFMAAGAYLASSKTGEAITKIEEDIKKLESLVNTINSQETGAKGSNALAQKNQTIKTLENRGLIINTKSGNEDIDLKQGSLPCITSDSKGNCQSFSSAMNALPGIANLPSGISSDLSGIVKLTDGLNGASKVSSGTLQTASTVATNAAALKRKLDSARREAQKVLTKNGNKLLLDKEEANFKSAMNAALVKSAKQSKLSLTGAYASLGSNLNAGSLSNGEDLEKAKALAESLKKTNANLDFQLSTPDSGAGLAGFKNLDMNDDKKDSSEGASDELANNGATAGKDGVSIDDYEMKNDINTDKGQSIFEVISRRYEKSGYPRLFKRLKE